MIKPVIKIFFALFLILIFEKCAQVAPLSGGNRDVIPPKLVEAIPANKTKNFSSDLIVLKFDEHIKLKDLPNQLIITPKLGFEPQIETDGKKLTISFKKQTLLPNTTYHFSFGKSIIDMTEGNSIPNFEYIFSTGDNIDTLKITGAIINGFNNKPEAGAIIGLYNKDEEIDSLPYKKTPNYITRSSESGEFAFSNLPKGIYKVFGLLDKNKNYLYDGDIEKLAYLDSDFNLKGDTIIKLITFKEEPSKVFVKKIISPYYGFSQIILNKKSVLSLNTLNKADEKNIYETNKGKEKDTLSFFYKDLKDTIALILKNSSFKKTDTLKVQLPKKPDSKKKISSITLNTTRGKIPFLGTLQLSFLNWIDTALTDISKIKLFSKQDSLIEFEKIKYKWLNINTFQITNKLKQGTNYTLKIDTNAFFDERGIKNDSLKLNFQTESETELGKISLKLLFNKKQSYLIQLTNEQEQIVKEEFISFSLSSSNAVMLNFTSVTPGTYFIKIVFDANENKKWDSGNFNSKIQPEHVFIHPKPIKVLSDWEIEEEILIKE
ncbi:MAG: Ig-like domain-containing protein [Bacteroidota bacterium]|nr:Ig-like domain-containing protein [Bacteroidota bacterium]